MSIRLLAQELYRLTREVTRLEDELAAAPPARREAIEQALHRAVVDRDRLRGALDGKKSENTHRT